MALTVTFFTTFADHIVRGYERLRGDGSTYGMGLSTDTDKTYGALLNLESAVVATADTDVISKVLPVATAAKTATSATTKYLPIVRDTLNKLEQMVRALTVTTFSGIEAYLTYYNIGAGGYWTALMPPGWRELYFAWKRAYPANNNVYFEILQGGTFRGTTYTNALGKFVVSGAGAGAFTDGAAVTSANYCGGFGNLKVSGLAGTGNVTITGVGFDPVTGLVTSSKTWITSVTANGDTSLAVGAGSAPANCLLIDVTNITIAAGITAGTIYVEAKKPTSRLAVPF